MNQIYHLNCDKCGISYWSRQPEPLLCPDCNDEYVSEEICPKCGKDRYKYHVPRSGGVINRFCPDCDKNPCPDCETIQKQLANREAQLAVARKVIQDLQTMRDTKKPRKLDEALTWRENDLLAEKNAQDFINATSTDLVVEWIESSPPYFSIGIRAEFTKGKFTLTYWHLPRRSAGWYLYKRGVGESIASIEAFSETQINEAKNWADNLILEDS